MIGREEWLSAQYSVLGSMLLDDSVVPKEVQQLRVTDFFGEGRTVYKAMVQLFQDGKPVDPVTVVHTLGPGYRELIKQLLEITPSAARIDTYMQICREQAQLVTVREIAAKLQETDSNEKARKLIEEAAAMMVDKTAVKIVSMEDAMRSFMDRHSGQVQQYLTWPIGVLNEVLYSEPGDFIIIGGKPSAGKSAFALQCAAHWSKEMKVGFFSLETGDGKLFDRMMSSLAQIEMGKLKKNNISDAEWNKICAMSAEVVKRNLDLIPASGMSAADIRSVTVMNGYQLIIIDYVQLIAGSGGNRTEEVTGISMALHRMAQDLGVTVVGLSQVRRQDPKQKRNMEASDLRESGQLEQDADAILLLELEQANNPGGNRKLFIAKNKEGETPMTVLGFDGKFQTFYKAQQTGSVINDMKAAANKAKRERAMQARTVEDDGPYEQEQIEMLPEGPPVPFED